MHRHERVSSGHVPIILSLGLILLAVVPDLTSADLPPIQRRPDPELDLSGGTDAPVLRRADFWNYSTEFEYDIMGLSIPFSGWLNMTVVQMSLDPLLDMAPVYITNVTGNISGHLYIPFIITIDIYIDLAGYMWSKVQDLSMYRTVLNASVSGSIPSLNGHYPFGYEFSPPLEEYDFPLVKGDVWWTNVSARAPFGASGDLLFINHTNSLGQEESLSVPAGTFSVLPISIDGKRSLFYNSTVGNTVRRTYDLDLDGTVFTVPLDLSSYGRSAYPADLDIEVSTVQPVRAGSTFSVSGTSSITNTVVTVFFPDGEIAAVVPLVLGDRDFDTVLEAPERTDDTLTSVDHGSFGVLAVLGALDSVAVTTVTTWSTDAEVGIGSLEISYTGGGTIDDTFTAMVRVRNPSNYAIEGLSVELVLEGIGTVLIDSGGHTIPAKEALVMSIEFKVADPGRYNLSLTVDPDDSVVENNESNNNVREAFSVKEREPLLWSFDPPPGNISVLEGNWTLLTAEASRGGRTLGGAWTLDEVPISTTGPFNFSANHTGDLSFRVSPYQVEHTLNDGETYEGERRSVMWNITVIDVNRPPVMNGSLPTAPEIWMAEGDVQYFSVEAYDPDSDGFGFEWRLDGADLPVHGPSFVLSPDFIGANSSEGSPFHLTVNVYDTKGSQGRTGAEWTINVNDTDRPFIYRFLPLPGNITVPYLEATVLSFNATDLDGTPIVSSWSCLGRVSLNVSEFPFYPPALGLLGGETVKATLHLLSGTHTVKAEWNITVLERPEEPPVLPPLGVSILSPTEGQEFIEGDNVTFIANASDTRQLDYVWNVDGEVYRGREVQVTGLGSGDHTASLSVYLSYDTSLFVTMTVNFTVLEKEKDHPGDDDDDGEDRCPYLWLLLLLPLVLLVVVPLGSVLLRKREDLSEWEE